MPSRVTTAPAAKPKLKPAPKPDLVPPEIRATMKYGHLPYSEVAKSNLPQLTAVGNGCTLLPPAAEAFSKMVAAAKKDGITLFARYGFRDLKTQEKLFNEHPEVPEAQRAKVRAPPGHSEHHTGYAVDINSKGEAMTEKSKAYKWLKAHGAEYGFENSFQKNNPQGVSFEPWHWRWVGNDESEQVFETAHSITPAPPKGTLSPWSPAR